MPGAKPLASFQQLRSNSEGMFQPQPTPYSSFSSYGVGNSIVDFRTFPQNLDSNGPTLIQNPVFSPVNHNDDATSRAPLNYNSDTLGRQRRYKMASDVPNDMERQEAGARDWQPSTEVFPNPTRKDEGRADTSRVHQWVPSKALSPSHKSTQRQTRRTLQRRL